MALVRAARGVCSLLVVVGMQGASDLFDFVADTLSDFLHAVTLILYALQLVGQLLDAVEAICQRGTIRKLLHVITTCKRTSSLPTPSPALPDEADGSAFSVSLCSLSIPAHRAVATVQSRNADRSSTAVPWLRPRHQT